MNRNVIQIAECDMLNEHQTATCRGCYVYSDKNEYAKVIQLAGGVEYG